MTGTKISLNGADTAHYRDAMAPVLHLTRFLDGIERHITLTRRQWEVHDAWHRDTGWQPTRILERAIQIVERTGADLGPHPWRYEESLRNALMP
jgi:hypothetical protein